MAEPLSTTDGRRAFGDDPAGYDSARPSYPDWVFERLTERGALSVGARVFEIGPGAGLATRVLMARGPASLTAIEPDSRLASHLSAQALAGVTVLTEPFEDAALEDGEFDLGVAATSFHWLDQEPALAKVARSLRPGGWWAMFANVFGDPDRSDPFHDATQSLLSGLPSGPSNGDSLPYALDHKARLADLAASGAFTDVTAEQQAWTLVLNPEQVRGLYATYSNITLRPPAERESILDQLAEIAAAEFSGRVERNMVTSLHMARRR